MNQTPARRLPVMAIASFSLALAACGGSEGDAVETFGLQFAAGTPMASVDMMPRGEGGLFCNPAYVYFEIENRNGAALPTDLAIDRVTISNADGSSAWSLPVRDFEIGSLQPPRRRVVAQKCALIPFAGRVIPFPTASLVTVTVELRVVGMRGRLQQHGVHLGEST